MVVGMPSEAPRAERAVDPRLEGAERGFWAWLNVQAWRREPVDAVNAAMLRDDLAAVVASHVLAAYLDVAPPAW